MAYEKFIPAVESANFLKEIERKSVFAKHCNREFEGDVKQLGDQIRVNGLGDVTIYSYNKDGSYTVNGTTTSGKNVIQGNMPSAETPEGYTATFTINQIETFHITIGDIDKELAKGGNNLLSKYYKKATDKIARLQDEYVARCIVGFKDAQFDGLPDYSRSGIYYLTTSTSSNSDGSETCNILDFIDELVVTLDERDLEGVKLFAEVTPKFYNMLRKALNLSLTDNNKSVEEREITSYNGIEFTKTNCKELYSASNDYMIIRTEEAVGFWNPLVEMAAYKLQDSGKGFGDAIMGYSYYDCGITAPKQMLWAKIHF